MVRPVSAAQRIVVDPAQFNAVDYTLDQALDRLRDLEASADYLRSTGERRVQSHKLLDDLLSYALVACPNLEVSRLNLSQRQKYDQIQARVAAMRRLVDAPLAPPVKPTEVETQPASSPKPREVRTWPADPTVQQRPAAPQSPAKKESSPKLDPGRVSLLERGWSAIKRVCLKIYAAVVHFFRCIMPCLFSRQKTAAPPVSPAPKALPRVPKSGAKPPAPKQEEPAKDTSASKVQADAPPGPKQEDLKPQAPVSQQVDPAKAAPAPDDQAPASKKEDLKPQAPLSQQVDPTKAAPAADDQADASDTPASQQGVSVQVVAAPEDQADLPAAPLSPQPQAKAQLDAGTPPAPKEEVDEVSPVASSAQPEAADEVSNEEDFFAALPQGTLQSAFMQGTVPLGGDEEEREGRSYAAAMTGMSAVLHILKKDKSIPEKNYSECVDGLVGIAQQIGYIMKDPNKREGCFTDVIRIPNQKPVTCILSPNPQGNMAMVRGNMLQISSTDKSLASYESIGFLIQRSDKWLFAIIGKPDAKGDPSIVLGDLNRSVPCIQVCKSYRDIAVNQIFNEFLILDAEDFRKNEVTITPFVLKGDS